MSWGLSSWGLTPYGIGDVADFDITIVEPRAELVVRVTLSRPALLSSALNPTTWIITDENGFTFTVLTVREVSTSTVFELYLLQKLGPSGISHTLSAPYLKDMQGGAINVSSVDFDGLQAAASSAGIRTEQYDFDKTIDNLFRYTAGGDYAMHSGTSLLKKLFYRRIITTPGEFFHLDEYGLGISLKEPLNSSRMVLIKGEVERQLGLEPEVESVSASLRLDSNGQLLIIVSARISRTGAEVKETFIPRVTIS